MHILVWGRAAQVQYMYLKAEPDYLDQQQISEVPYLIIPAAPVNQFGTPARQIVGQRPAATPSATATGRDTCREG